MTALAGNARARASKILASMVEAVLPFRVLRADGHRRHRSGVHDARSGLDQLVKPLRCVRDRRRVDGAINAAGSDKTFCAPDIQARQHGDAVTYRPSIVPSEIKVRAIALRGHRVGLRDFLADVGGVVLERREPANAILFVQINREKTVRGAGW